MRPTKRRKLSKPALTKFERPERLEHFMDTESWTDEDLSRFIEDAYSDKAKGQKAVLRSAIYCRRIRVVRGLVQNGLEIQVADDDTGRTGIHMAMRYGLYETIKLLLEVPPPPLLSSFPFPLLSPTCSGGGPRSALPGGQFTP